MIITIYKNKWIIGKNDTIGKVIIGEVKMKILKRVGISSLILLIIYGVFGFFFLPNILKNIINENAQKTLNRPISMESISFNPFIFEMDIEKFFIHSVDKGRTLAGVRELRINIDPFDLIGGEIRISQIKLSSPFITLHKDKTGKFNFSDLLESNKDENDTDKSKTKLPKFVIEKFAIRRGKLNFIDETGLKVFSQTLKPINFTLKDFSPMKEHANALSLHIEIDDGAYLDYSGKVNSVEPLRLEGVLNLHSGRLYTQWKYFQDQLGFIVADGSLDASMSYSADFSEEKPKIYINQYQVAINQLRLQEKGKKEDIFKLPSLKVSGSADVSNQTLKVDNFDIKGFSIKATRNAKGEINWLGYFPPSQKSPDNNVSQEKGWNLEVAKLNIQMKDSSFEEHYAPRAYKTGFEELNLGLKDVRIESNVFSLPFMDVHLQNIKLQTLDQEVPFSVERLKMQARAELAQEDINVSMFLLDGLSVKMKKDVEGKLSYLSYIPKSDQKSVQKEKSSMQWVVEKILIKNSELAFSNHYDALNGLTTLEDIEVKIEDLSSKKGTWAKSQLNMKINKTANLGMKSKIRQNPLKIVSSLDMKGLDLVKMQAYMDKKANIDIKRGSMDLNFDLVHDDKGTEIIANVQMNQVNMAERYEGKTFFAFSKLRIKELDLSLNPNQLKIEQVDILEPYARMKIDENKTSNLHNISVQASKEEDNATKDPFAVFIGKVNFKEGRGEFSDLSLPLPFKTDIHDLNGRMIGLGTLSDIKSVVNLDGTIDKYGLMKIEGSLLSSNPKVFTDMRLKFQNIDMTNLSPYTGKFIGHELKEGKMNVELSYKIDDAQMMGGNRIILKRMNLGEAVESDDAISAPVGLAIALLKDSEGVIDLDVPVSGDVNAPEFAIGKVVWTALKNLITGVATAPFRFLGDILGVSADELENIEFEEGKYTLLPPQKETLDKLSEALISKKMLLLKVAGSYDEKRDLLAIQTALLYEEALSKLDDKTTDISKMDREELDRLLKEMYLSHFAKDKFDSMEEKIDAKEISDEVKVFELREGMKQALIEDQKVSKEDLIALARSRGQSIMNYLIEKGVEGQRLEGLDPVEVNIQTQDNEYIPTKLELAAK